MDVQDVAADLVAEQQALDDVVAGLDAADWAAPTPSAGWAVSDQVAHLTYFDRAAATAITAPEAFRASVEELWAAARRNEGDDLTLGPFRALSSDDLLAAWRDGRTLLAKAAVTLTDEDRVEWYGPSMGARSFLTARLMEAWAHGQDVVDAVGGHRPASDRLRHVAQLGVITRRWSYANRKMAVPDVEIGVALTAPSGGRWTWGPGDAPEVIRGPAEDFCLVVTQRRHLDDTDLEVVGDAARDWLLLAQAFAGPPSDGPDSGSF